MDTNDSDNQSVSMPSYHLDEFLTCEHKQGFVTRIPTWWPKREWEIANEDTICWEVWNSGNTSVAKYDSLDKAATF